MEKVILDFADRRALQIETEVFYSGEEFYRSIQEQCPYDLIFLDIQLLEMDGVQVGRQIREQLGNNKISIVYISSKETYAMSLFQVRPLDFLIKPLNKEKVAATLEQFIKLSETNKNELYYHAGKSVCRLYLDEIHYFACNGRKVEIYCIVSVLFTSVTDSRQYLIATSISVSLLFVFWMILEKAGKSRQERERELLKQEVRIYENQFGIIRQSQHNIRALKHDMKHHIKMLTDMVSGGENEAALRYLASMGAFMESSEEYVATGNEMIDSILNYIISKAKNAGVDVSWKIQIPEHLEIPVFDINVILSNLFENAMNALSDVTEPSFHIMMKYDRGILCISTHNNCPGKGQMSGISEGHGFGLKNIRRIAEKYHGSLAAADRDLYDVFIVYGKMPFCMGFPQSTSGSG